MSYVIRAHDGKIDTKKFNCGHLALNDYIRRYAAQDVKRDLTRVFVATPEDDINHLAGFFTLSAGSIKCSDLPETVAQKLPRYPIPVALIGRLAVDEVFQGKGLGSILLAEACLKVKQASASLAVVGIVVDAKDDSAAAFYRHFGFISLPGKSDRLLLPNAAYFWLSDAQQPESHHQIIKAADTLSAYLKCLSELRAGNLEFSITTSELEQKLNDSALPEVGYFMQSFVPACALPLEGILKVRPVVSLSVYY